MAGFHEVHMKPAFMSISCAQARISMRRGTRDCWADGGGSDIEALLWNSVQCDFSPARSACHYNRDRDSVIDHTMAQVITLRKAMSMASCWTWVAALVATYRSAATPSASVTSPSDPDA